MEKVGDVADCHGCIRGLPLVNEEDRLDGGAVSILALSDQRSGARPVPGWCVNE